MSLNRALRALALVALFFFVLGAPRNLRAQEVIGAEEAGGLSAQTKGEFSAYTDTDAVSVWSPAVGATVGNPLAGWSTTGTYMVDVVSAASVDVVSAASGRWREKRQAASLSGTLQPSTFGITTAGSVSYEPDYLSLTGGAQALVELANKNVTPSIGYSYGHDTAGRTGTPFSVYSLELQRHSFNGGLELVLDPTTLVTFVLDAVFERGHQEKPYRFLPMFLPGTEMPAGASVAQVNAVRLPGRISENDPDSRNRFAFTGRVAQRLKGSTFVVSERLYADDWGLKATTTDLRLLFDLSRRVFLWTHVRGHIQSGVSFYNRVYIATVNGDTLNVPHYRTGDRELTPLVSGTAGVGLRWFIGSDRRPDTWSLVLQGEVTNTSFSDALFIQTRQAFFSALQVEAQF